MLLYIPFWVRMWTLCSQPIRLQSSRSEIANASSRCQTGVRAGISPSFVILSAAKDLIPVASGDEVLRCAQDDKWRSETPSHPAAEQHHRACRPVAFRMPAAAREVPGVARTIGLRLAARCDGDGALQHHR